MYPAPVLNAAEMFSWWHFSLSTNCLSLKCCVVIPIPKRRDLLLRMGGRNAQENNLFEDVSTGFMNNDSLSDLSSKVQFRWYDNAENVLSPWGGSCFSGGVLLFPHYCHAVPEALCQSCCAAACECWGWWRSDPGGSLCFVLVYSWILDICFPFFQHLISHGAVLLRSWEPEGQSLLPGTLIWFFSHLVFFHLVRINPQVHYVYLPSDCQCDNWLSTVWGCKMNLSFCTLEVEMVQVYFFFPAQ